MQVAELILSGDGGRDRGCRGVGEGEAVVGG